MNRQLITILLGVAITVNVCMAESETMSYSDIVERLYDVKHLATQPQQGEKSGNFSSWDRGAKYDEAAGKYVNWHANGDGDGFMDSEGLMMKLDGPGVIWRIWSAMPEKGSVDFFIDGADKPVIAGSFIEMFNNSKPPFNYPELVHMKAKGQNFFIPIPFQKSILIRGNKGWGKYYQITYTKFPEGTTVPSFSGTFSDADKAALGKANDIWGRRGARLFVSEGAEAKQVTVELAPGEEKVVAEYQKPAAITSFTADRPAMTRAESLDILRELTVSMVWDDDKAPAVWAPLGDFFGTSGGENLYRSLTTGMTGKEYYSNWYMPFSKARIVVRNDGKDARKLAFTIHTENVSGVDKLLRYHCKWHRDDFSGFDKDRLMADRWPDWPVLKVDGAAGRFCGFHAHMWNPNHNWNKQCKAQFAKPIPDAAIFAARTPLYKLYTGKVSNNYWWGEGDEKFFVDGEKMPSTFGTGSEDYFGYAWGTPEAYDSALQAQPLNGAADEIGKSVDRAGPGNIGHIAMVRWQIADNVPFQKSFEAVIEKYHPNEWPLLNAYGVCWYQSAGTADYYGLVPAKERTGYYVPAKPKKKMQ